MFRGQPIDRTVFQQCTAMDQCPRHNGKSPTLSEAIFPHQFPTTPLSCRGIANEYWLQTQYSGEPWAHSQPKVSTTLIQRTLSFSSIGLFQFRILCFASITCTYRSHRLRVKREKRRNRVTGGEITRYCSRLISHLQYTQTCTHGRYT